MANLNLRHYLIIHQYNPTTPKKMECNVATVKLFFFKDRVEVTNILKSTTSAVENIGVLLTWDMIGIEDHINYTSKKMWFVPFNPRLLRIDSDSTRLIQCEYQRRTERRNWRNCGAPKSIDDPINSKVKKKKKTASQCRCLHTLFLQLTVVYFFLNNLFIRSLMYVNKHSLKMYFNACNNE